MLRRHALAQNFSTCRTAATLTRSGSAIAAELADRYLILIEGGPPSNYSAWSPDLPGCVATGGTLEEIEHEMREAIAFHLEGLAEDGAPIPEPSGPGVYVERKARAVA